MGFMGMALAVLAGWCASRLVGSTTFVDPWDRGVARTVVGMGTIVGVLTFLAAIGLLQPLAISIAFAAVVLMAWPLPERPHRRRWSKHHWGRWSAWTHVPLLLSLLVTGWYWMRQSLGAAYSGFTEFDTVHYHLPHAARMAQDGHLWALNVVTPAWPVHFYPSNVELLAAAVLTSVRSDVPVVIFGLVSLAMFVSAGIALVLALPDQAARPTAAVLGATALLVVANGGTIGYLGPGTAGNDLFVTSAVLAGVALLAKESQSVRRAGMAGMAVGLSAGTKLTALAPAAAILVWVILRFRRRLRIIGAFLAAAIVSGGIWYLRNLILAGNPIPGLDLTTMEALFRTTAFPTTQELGTPIAALGADWDAWSRLASGWTASHGVFWPVLVGIVAYGCVDAWRRGGTSRAIAVVTIATAVAYVFTPWTAFGPNATDIELVAATTRYALVPLSLGCVLAARAAAFHFVHARAMGIALVLTLAGTLRPFHAGDPSVVVAIVSAVLMLCVAGLVIQGMRRGRPALLGVASLLVVVALLAGAALSGTARSTAREPYTSIAAWADGHTNKEIGHAGWYAVYLLYGTHLTNSVRSLRVGERLGEDGDPGTCGELVTAMADFDAVVLGPWIRWADQYRAQRAGEDTPSPVREMVVDRLAPYVIVNDGGAVLIDTSSLPPVSQVCRP